MMDLLLQALSLKEELDGLRPLKKEDEQKIFQKFRLDWNYHSNRIEGNSLTYGETKALILFGITAQGKPLKDHFEVTGHNEAVNWVYELVKQQRPLSEKFIRELHLLLLKESYYVDAITPNGNPTRKKVEVGKYKTIPNHVETKTGEIFYFSSPEETPAKMNDLLAWYKMESENKNSNPILLAINFHYRFVKIHPFDDGNGRTARILMNFILMRFGFPPVVIKSEDREEYLSALQQADAELFIPFIEFVTRQLIHSLEIMIKGANGLSIYEHDDIDKEIILLEQKINNVGKLLKVKKSIDAIQFLLDNSIKPLFELFLKKSSLFDRYYFDCQRILIHEIANKGKEFVVDGTTVKFEAIPISDKSKSIAVQYMHKEFREENLKQIQNSSAITIALNELDYEIFSLNTSLGKRRYDEILSEEEMIEIVNHLVKIHKRKIEISLDRFNDNKD